MPEFPVETEEYKVIKISDKGRKFKVGDIVTTNQEYSKWTLPRHKDIGGWKENAIEYNQILKIKDYYYNGDSRIFPPIIVVLVENIETGQPSTINDELLIKANDRLKEMDEHLYKLGC